MLMMSIHVGLPHLINE